MAEQVDMAVDQYRDRYKEAEGIKGTLTKVKILREAKKHLGDYYRTAKGEITGEYPYKEQTQDFYRKHELQRKIKELEETLLVLEMKVDEYMG